MARDQGGKHIVVAGGGFAGLGAAYTARALVPEDVRVTVVDPQGNFTFAPSLVWVALGRPLLRSSFLLDAALLPRNIGFRRARVREVRANDHVIVAGDQEIGYDRLIIATGGRPAAHSVPGLAGEFRAAGWIVGEDSAMEARTTLERIFADPGPVVVGAARNASYISAADELALSLDSELRKRGIRDRVPLTFVTAESTLGDFGFGKDVAGKELSALYAARNIATRVGAEITAVSTGEVTLSTGEKLPAGASIIMPPFTGSPDIWKSSGLTDERGLIPVTAEYRHSEQPDVYAAGVACYFEQPVPPLLTGRAPHTGYLSLHMGKAAGRNAVASLGYGRAASDPLPYVVDVRVIDGGDTGIVSASWGRSSLSSRSLTLPGRSSHLLKSAIERYLLWSLRTGNLEYV